MQKFILFFIVLLTGSIFLQAQDNCSCTEYAALQNSNNDDSTIAATLIKSAASVCKAKGYQLMGSFYGDVNEMDTAIFYLQKAEKLYKESKCGDSILLLTYKTLAFVYYTKGDFAKAQEYSFKMLQSAEAAENIYEQANCHTMIAQLFNQMAQAEKGIMYARLAIPMIDKIESPQKAADIMFKLSKRYLWHFQDTKKQSSLDSSELFSYRQLAIAKKIKRNSSIAAAYNNLQGIAWEKEDYKKALQYLDSSFLYTDKSDINTLAINYFDKADLYIELKNYPAAKQMADSALHYYKLAGTVSFIGETYELQARIAKETGDYKAAYENNELARSINDSIRNIDKVKQVTELEKKYSQVKNENIIKDLDRKKQLYFFLAIAGLLAALAIAFYLRQQRLQHKKDILETEQRLNRARMNPHFFFNALTTLQKFALRDNDGQALASNLSRFSNIMRETLESTYKEYVTVEQEMEFLNEYLEVQKIRFPKTFSYEVYADKNLEVDDILIPSMILQPFVENSIEHGFAGIDYPGNINIAFKTAGKEILIQITDNGKGLATTAKENNEHISRASQIIKDRIYLLNIKLKTKAGFSIDNDASGQGVVVKIHLPLLYKSQQ
jgi:tetratricopeptide (TPR) repeat protein/anti-sigma regulatory factor (Ser/Thr protein kinase)